MLAKTAVVTHTYSLIVARTTVHADALKLGYEVPFYSLGVTSISSHQGRTHTHLSAQSTKQQVIDTSTRSSQKIAEWLNVSMSLTDNKTLERLIYHLHRLEQQQKELQSCICHQKADYRGLNHAPHNRSRSIAYSRQI